MLILLALSGLAQQLPLPIDSTSKAGLPSFALTNTNFVADVGSYSNPAIADLDADGDYDILIGNSGGQTQYWRNDGDNTAPVWVQVSADLIGVPTSYSSPSITDFDNDGDFDLFMGYSDGIIRYYENTGTDEAPSFTYIRNIIDVGSHVNPTVIDYNADGNPDLYYGRDAFNLFKFKNDVAESGFDFKHFYLGDVGQHSSVDLGDIDNDGDFDAVVGGNDGRVRIYKNTLGTSPAIFTDHNAWNEEPVLFDVGGLAAPEFVDLDNDGDLDLFIGKSDGTFTYYRNDGTAQNAFWTLVENFFTNDAGDNAEATFADLDDDGDLDLIIGNQVGFISYYENQGSAESPNFILSGTSIVGDIGTAAKPELVDIDFDGDYDLTVGRSDGIIQFYNNTGTASVFAFTQGPNILNDFVDYTNPSFADLDGDGDLDLATGSGNRGGWVELIENTGSTTFSFSNQRSYWFDNFPRGFKPDFIDFDGDGDYDMFGGQENGFLQYYRNDGTPEKPQWTYMRNLLGDFGDWTSMAMGDMNNDGLIDFFLGRSNDALVRYFENDVDESGFNFVLNETNLGGDVGSDSNPEFADLDNDGDLDMIMGANDGRVRYYENQGSAENPNFVAQADIIEDQGSHSAISVGDMDGDNDLDLVVGRSNDGFLRYYRNDGNATVASFVLDTTNILSSNCRPSTSWCVPEIVDFDADGDLDLLVGTQNGYTRYWRNDGTPQIFIWADQGDLIGDIGSNAAPTVGDLDGDGDFDVIVVESNGFMRYYKNRGTSQAHAMSYVYSGPGGFAFLPDIGTNLKPELVDINNDGLLDVAVGENNGQTRLYINNGLWQTAQDRANNPTWIQLDTSALDSDRCDPGSGTGYCQGELVDIDADGDLDFLGGNYNFAPIWWENTGNNEVFQFQNNGRLFGDLGDSTDSSVADFDGDGDYDIIVGYIGGNVRYIKNVGTPEAPSFNTVYSGQSGAQYLTDLGDYAQVDAVDINNDGLIDLFFAEHFEGTGNTDQYFLKNNGLLTGSSKADDPTWLFDGTALTFGRNYIKSSTGDIDGDGDFDLIVIDDLNRIYYYRNEGTQGNPSFVLDSQITDLSSDWGRPALADFDGDGDLDLVSGQGNGFLNFFNNTGDYSQAMTITVKNNNGSAVENATAVFSDGSGVVCSNQTDNLGQVRCPINFIGEGAELTVENAEPGTITLGIFSPNSQGRTTMSMENPSTSFTLEFERFVFSTADALGTPNNMKVSVSDDGINVFSVFTSGGFLDGFFPKKYLENKQEPFTQNRIQYDINLERNTEYSSDLNLNGVFVPNSIAFNPPGRLSKLIASPELSTDAIYKGFVFYPALSAQREYQLNDSLPAGFSFSGSAKVSYLGSECEFPVSGTFLSVDPSTPGCDFLATPVTSIVDWLKLEYTFTTPSLATFQALNISNESYTFPGANLALTS